MICRRGYGLHHVISECLPPWPASRRTHIWGGKMHKVMMPRNLRDGFGLNLSKLKTSFCCWLMRWASDYLKKNSRTRTRWEKNGAAGFAGRGLHTWFAVDNTSFAILYIGDNSQIIGIKFVRLGIRRNASTIEWSGFKHTVVVVADVAFKLVPQNNHGFFSIIIIGKRITTPLKLAFFAPSLSNPRFFSHKRRRSPQQSQL